MEPIDQSKENLNRKLLSNLKETERKALCSVAKQHINFAVKISETIDEANLYEFDYGNGLKKEKFAIPCSSEDGMYLFNQIDSLNEGARLVIILRVLISKLLAVSRRSDQSEKKVPDLQ